MYPEKSMIDNRIKYLEHIIEDKQQSLLKAPEGKIRIVKIRSHPHYYWRKDPKEITGSYIREKDHTLARKLAQKSYDLEIVAFAKKEKEILQKLQKCYEKGIIEDIYSTLPPIRQALIEPVYLPDDQYIERWLGVPYERKGFSEDAPEYYTVRGERVRSKSEIIIADILNRMNIPYRYEFPIRLKGAGIIHPDFTVLKIKTREEMLWEHLGMMDDAEYAEKALERIDLYLRNGYYPGLNLILTHETSKRPIRNKLVEEMIDKYFR